ncbi:sensor histidine kinase [Lacticaseibacillus pabuli]|uniref:histidine kinase n=1 Tax=Lacticaseibacillus pabuli TaxID=3025672 RepID=A0ABY7WT22_9LACO|nr:sensor histidine kinase [Lacticaseibacillus sp. KACC 23028]WDF82939.1 sensor histidine kinase [Lacticaseibacillus sp. KACC 23028]
MSQTSRKWRRNLLSIEWSSYIWLFYVPFNLQDQIPPHSLVDWLWLGLGALFILNYVAVNERPHWRRITIPLELLITGVFAIVGMDVFMIIFPAFQVAFIFARDVNGTRKFSWFALCYYLIFAVFVYRGFQQGLPHAWEITALIFPMLAPIGGYVIARQTFSNWNLAQTNRRLQAVVQRDERERIARDLHDNLGQSFSMITVKTELAKKLLEKAPDRVAGELDDIEAVSRANLQLVRQIVNGLHDVSFSELLLKEEQNLTDAGITLSTAGEEAARQWPTTVQTQLAGAMREALTNVIRHARAHRVMISFDRPDNDYRVQIQDDGVGKTYVREGSNGMTNMQARLSEANGTMTVQANRIGTLVNLTVPKGAKS